MKISGPCPGFTLLYTGSIYYDEKSANRRGYFQYWYRYLDLYIFAEEMGNPGASECGDGRDYKEKRRLAWQFL